MGPKDAFSRIRHIDDIVRPPKQFGVDRISKGVRASKADRVRASRVDRVRASPVDRVRFVRETSDPFHHDTNKHGPRQVCMYHIQGRWHKIAYAEPPTADEQMAFLRRPAVVCPSSTLEQMKLGDSPVLWLISKLKRKLGVPWAPDVLSAAITPSMLADAKETGDWGVVKRVQEYAYIDRRGCHVSHSRGCPNVPRLLEGIKMGVSRFGNPFANLPPVMSRTLFERLIDNDFHPLSDEQVQEAIEVLVS